MKNFNNLITMTNVMRHNSQNAVNPDGQPTVNRQSRLMLRQGYLRNLAMIFAVLVLSMANVGLAWADTELANINFKSWTPQSISAGSTVNGCYFKSAVTISADKGASFGGNATTSSNWVAIPLSGINGSITITLTHANSNPQWKNYFKGLNAAPSSSDLSSSPSSVGDNTRPGSNTTTSSWTISTDKLYGVFYVGKGSNGLNDIYSISISTPDWTYYYRGADNSWGGTEMTKSSAGFYSYKSSTTNNHQFKIAKSTEGWDYNYSFVDAGYLGTSITTIGDYGKDNCYIWSAPASYYIIVFRPGSVMNTTANPKICASATLPAEKFTISFNNGGGSGSMSSISNVLYGSEKVTPANTFTKSGYRFTGWKANVDVKVGGATKTAGTLLDDEVTIQEIKSDITLTAQWEVDDGCNKIFAFAYSTDATNAGVTNSTSTFTGFSTGSNDCSGSITIDGKLYSVTKRGSNSTFSITFSVPANKVGTLFGLANSSGTSARTLTLSNGDGYSRTQSSSASKTSATAITYTDMPAGSYTLSADNGASVPLLCLKLCAAGECEATQPGTISKGTLSGCSLRLTAAGSPETNNTWYWQSSADGTDKTESGATKDVTTTGTYYIRSFCSTGSGCWSDARTVTVSASDLTPAATTALAKSSVTAKGVKLTVTDPANTNNYDLYVSTSSTAPTSGSTPTYTISESKSKTITNLVAGTTYYAWARAKCGSNKSTWTALGDGGNFTTSTVTVTHTLTNVTKTSGAETAGGSNYTAEFAAVSGYSMPTPTVTIDGNTATSGTDYTWSSGTLTIPANKINGNIVITLNSAAAAPSSVAITGNWLYFAGETIELTATPTGGNGPVTYQWYKGGKENGNAIEGATTATYTKATCAFDDAGSYYCKVTCGGSQSTWGQSGDAYNVKIPRLYVKTGHNYDPAKTDFGNVDFTRATASTATASIVLGSNWDYCFNIADGCGHYYGNAGTMQYNNCGPWTTNVNNQDCGLRTTNGATYVFTINYSNWEQLTTTVTYPVANQAADKVIYFDNNDRNWSTLHYRIGRTDHTQATAMTKVHGTANLYKITTAEYNNFTGWHIANNAGWTGDNNSIYRTYTDGDEYSITYATAHEGGAVTDAAITVTPTTSRGMGGDKDLNDNCEFYNYEITTGMKTQNVSITDYSNGTITVNYTNTSGSAATLTSGSADLAHTVILTSITAVPNTGYDAGAITINGSAYSANHVVTGATTIAASFTPHVYTITYKDQGNVAFSGTHTDTPSAHPTSHTYNTATDLNSATKAGYTFDGWYTTSACTGDPVTSLGATDYTADITLYAKWTAAASLTAISADVQYNAADMANITFTGSDQHFTGLSTNHLFKVYGTLGSTDAFGKNETIGNITDDISEKSFTSAVYITAADNKTETADPTQGAIEFITPSTSGKLYLYLNGTASTLTLKKKDTSTSTSLSGAKYKAMTVDANTHYFINGAGSGNRGLYAIKYVSTYGVTITTTNVTKTDGATGAGAAIKGKSYTATFTAKTGYTLPSDVTVTIGGVEQTKGTGYTWTISAGTATLTVPADKVTGNIVVSVAGVAAVTHDVTFSLTNVAYSSGDNQGTGAATEGVEFSTIFAASSGYSLPGTITVTIGGVEQTAGTGYTWAQGSGTLTIQAAYVTDDIVVTIVGEEMEGDGCDELVHTQAATATTLSTSVGTATVSNTSSQSANSKAIKLNSSGYVELSPKTGKSFAAGDSLIVVIYNQATSAKTTGFKIGSTDYTASIAKQSNYTFRQKLVAANIVSNKVKIERNSSDGWFVSAIIKHCEDLPSCTTPTLPTLSNQTVCPGSDIAAWDATPTNIATITGASEDVAYSWKKKGNDTEIEDEATLDLGAATESMAGTYVVTVTVSKTGYISKSASAEVDLTVTPATETPSVTASRAKVYATDEVTLTATCGSTGVTWNWYLCANSDGTGAGSSLGTSATYTIASAPAAGTYYYKAVATGDGTHSCGAAEYVYTLVVSPAAGGDCFHFVSVIPESNINISSGASIVTPTHATTLEGGTMKVGSQQVVITAGYGLKMEGTKTVSITLDAALEAGNVVIVKGTSATKGYGITINGVNFYDADNKTFDVSYTVLADDGLVGQTALNVTKYSGSSYLQEIKITGCGASCTDPEVTASADNTTACVGTSVTFTATGAHAEADYQWQKLDGTWTNISGADASTYYIPSVVAGDAGKYRVIASHNCNRTSNEVTLSVPSAPNFGSTVPASVSIMQTLALSINTVEATDAVKYKWYKSADPTWDAGDTEIGTNKELIKAYDGEATGSPSYYIFCRAQNACGIATSTAIAVNVTEYVEEDCATKGNEDDAEFGFENTGCGSGNFPNTSTPCWNTNSKSKYLTYTAPDGKYFDKAKVTVAVSSDSKAAYGYSTDGSSYTYANLTGLSSALAEKTIDLPANVTHFRIGRNFDSGYGVTSGTFYLSKICFEYTDACTATTVTPSTTSKTYVMDGSSFTKPTFTVKHGGTAFDPQPTLSYSSSNEDIASVDDDGTVTFNGEAGTVTITAAYAGNATYCASEGSYTITVTCPGGAPKVVADGSVDMSGCNSSVTLHAKKQDGTAFDDGTYQWFRNGEEIDGETSSSYTATQAGTYTVARTNTSDCTTPSTNSAIVTSETTEPEVERLVPFQYYHVNKTYSDQMKMRHLFAVKNSGTLDGKHFKMYVSRNGGAATDVTSSDALVVWPNRDGHVDTVMVNLNKLSDKYSENDELVFTCKAIDCESHVSETYKSTIQMHVIGATPTLALICSGSNKASGTRKTSELTVGGDFLTGYNVADLCQQTGNTSFDANTEWGLYTRLKENYIVTPVNGYAVFNKLNYEPFDILLLTDYPKASKSDAAAAVLDDMADLCDYRPMLSFKAHMVAKTPSKWAAKGFTTSPVVPKNTRTRLNIVCYAHPMFADMKTAATHIQNDYDDPSQIVYTMLTGAGYEGSKGLQGFELEAAENFVTIGLVHYNATPEDATPSAGLVTWTPGSGDRMLVTAVERQKNPEARMIMFAVNCGAQSKFTETGRNVVLRCLEYLLTDHTIKPMADCSFTFDNGAGNSMTADEQAAACEFCTGTKGDHKWSTAANWGPDYVVRPGKDTEVKIAASVEVDMTHAIARSARIVEGGHITIPAGKALEIVGTIRRLDGTEISPTEENDIHIGSSETGNGTLIFNNNSGDTKARVDMYSKGFIDHTDPEKEPNGVKNYQYIGTPFVEINALYNYYGSWIYSWGTKKNGNLGWVVVKNGGPMRAWTGYCITQEAPTYHQMSGTLTATGTVDITVPANANMVVGNSWTAPIDINALTTDDLEGLTANIYFFNTGVDKTGTAGAAGSRYAGSTYVTVPVEAARYEGEDDHINSLQGFFVKNPNGSAGTLHLDYERHVRKTTRDNILSDEMHAPARRTALSSDEPVVLKMKVSGENYDDKLLLLEREDFTTGFDNGWDGDKWDGNESALYIYTTDNNGTENSVSAIPELEGTIIGFRAGEDDAYTLNFEYLNSDEPLYLYDVENNTYTQIMTGMTYRFFTTDNEKHERFIITRSNGQEVATGVEPVSGSLDRSKAKKLLIENKMFIMVNGMLYDATGKVVK